MISMMKHEKKVQKDYGGDFINKSWCLEWLWREGCRWWPHAALIEWSRQASDPGESHRSSDPGVQGPSWDKCLFVILFCWKHFDIFVPTPYAEIIVSLLFSFVENILTYLSQLLVLRLLSLCYSLLPKTFLTDLSDLLVGKGEGISYPVVHLVSVAEPHLIIRTWCNNLIKKTLLLICLWRRTSV